MILPPAAQVPYNVQSNDYLPSANDLKSFDRSDITGVIKEFLLRQLLKREVRENDREQIVTDVSVVDLKDGHTIYGHNESTVHFAASVNKLPVTMLVLEELRAGRVTLDTQVSWAVSDQRGGNGVYDQAGAPLTATVRDVLHDLLNRSGNTAVRILTNKVLGGSVAVNNRLAQVPQIPNTRLIPLDADRFYLGNTTSKEALFILQKVLSNQDQYGQYIKELLVTNIFVNDGVRSQLASNDYIVLANKTGLLYDPDGDNFHDVGIVYNTKTKKSYGYSFLTTAPHDSVTAPPRADQSLKEMGKYVLRFSGDKLKHTQQQQSPQLFKSSEQQVERGRIVY